MNILIFVIQATSNEKGVTYKLKSNTNFDNRDSENTTNDGMVNLHHTKG